MAQLMLINPKRRTRKKTASRKRRTVRRNPVAANPRRRRRSVALAARRAVRRVRRNPSARALGGGVMNDVMNAAIGAGGAIGVNMIYDMLPLPLSMKSGMAQTVGKAATAIALGIVGKKVLGRAAGQMAAGALTVIAYDAIKGFMPAPGVAGLGYMNPGINAGYLPQQGMGEYVDTRAFSTGMGEYVY